MQFLDVDVAIAIPVNIAALTDDTDFITPEITVAYNAAGMALVWNFTTTAGVFTQTAVTPTTAGVHDWTHKGKGVYTLEVPLSGGTINNDTEGYGYFSGTITGVLPFTGPTYGFRAATLNNQLIDSQDSGDYPATQSQVGSLSSGAGGLSTISASRTLTTGSETGTFANTAALDSVYHQITPSAGNTEIYYEFSVGVTGRTTGVVWNGYVQSNNDDMAVYGYDWAGTAWVQIGTIAGKNGTADEEHTFVTTNAMTGTGANIGVVRIRFLSTDATQMFVDRILCQYTSLAAESTIFSSGVAQTGAANSIQLASGAVSTNDQFRRAKVIITSGTGAGQETIITSSVASTDTLTVTPAWLVNPDNTSSYEILPAQSHSTVRNGGYDNGNVYVNTVSGSAGTEKGVNGTSTNKSDNLADAYAIGVEENISMLNIDAKSVLVLPSDSSGIEFNGDNYSVALNSQNIADCTFRGAASITGISTASAGVFDPTFFLCGIGTATIPPSNGFECGFFGTFTLATAGFYTFGASAAVFGLSPVIDFGAALNASGFFLPNWTGGQMTIKNYGVGTGTYQFEISGNGELVIDATCTGGTIIRRGNINIVDNSGGAVTVISLANITPEQVNAEVDTGISDASLATASNLAIVDGVVDAILVDTGTTLPATLATIDGIVDAILVDTATTIPALIAALNDLSALQVNAEVDTALTDYDGPTRTEATADKDSIETLINALNDISTTQVNAEVVDVIDTDTTVELTAPPSATSSLRARIGWLFALARNKITQTATIATLRNDDDDGSIATSTDSDDGTTATRGEWTP